MRAVRSSPFTWLLLLVSVFVPVSKADAACMQCDPSLQCVDAPLGARFCVMSAMSCSLLWPCTGMPSRESDGPIGGSNDVTTFTLFDATPGMRVQPARRSGSLPLALGDEMRIAAGLGAAPIAEAAVAYGRDFGGMFIDDSGEGFALRRIVEGTAVRLEVREVRGEQTGALLASELLGEGDQLIVPVRMEDRDRVLVLQTRSGPRLSARLDLARIKRTLLTATRANTQRTGPLFKVRSL
jgi:hypothetical protein